MDPQQLQNIIAHLQEQINTQGQQLAHAQQLLQQAAAVPVAVAAPGGAAPRVSGPRLPPPIAYDGSSSILDNWIAELTRQFAWYNTPDAERVRFATAFLRGAAWDWWQHLSADVRPISWDGFLTILRRRFQPVTTAETARAKLLQLTQGKMNVNDYVAAFRTLLVAVPDMSGADRLFQFLRGLRASTATQLRMQGVTSLDDAIEKAARIGSAVEFAHVASVSSSSSYASSSQPSHSAMELDNIEGLERDTDSSATPAAADDQAPVTQAQFREFLAAMRDARKGGVGKNNRREGRGRRLPTIPHLSPEQVREYMDAGKCFGCGSTEHRGRDCPKRKVDGNGNVSWPSSN